MATITIKPQRNNPTRNPREYFYLATLLLAVIGIIFYFSNETPWIVDDFVYQYFIDQNGDGAADYLDAKPIDSLGDIALSQYNHYLTTNGRTWAHFLVQGFCGIWGHALFALFNAIAYVVLFALIAKIANRRLSNISTFMTIAALAVLSFQTLMTPSCQIGYIWTADTVLGFIYLLRREKSAPRIWALPVIFLFSLLAGWSNEAYVIGFGGALLIYVAKHLRSLSAVKWIMLIGFGIGGLLLCLSPGTIGRTADQSNPLGESLLTIAISLKAMALLVAIIIYQKLIKKTSLKLIYRNNAFYFNALFILLIFNLVIGIRANRQLFGIELISIILILRVLPKGCFNKLWLTIFTIAASLFVAHQLVRLHSLQNQLKEIESQYAISDDGVVYVDTPTFKFYSQLEYVPMIAPPHETVQYSEQTIRNTLAYKYPGKKDLKILPVALRGMESIDLGNKVIEDNSFSSKKILVQSIDRPARFFIERKLLGLLPISPVEVDFSNPLITTEFWRAVEKGDQSPLITYGDVKIEQCD